MLIVGICGDCVQSAEVRAKAAAAAAAMDGEVTTTTTTSSMRRESSKRLGGHGPVTSTTTVYQPPTVTTTTKMEYGKRIDEPGRSAGVAIRGFMTGGSVIPLSKRVIMRRR